MHQNYHCASSAHVRFITCVYVADDTAPPARKSRWLATFYLCIPVGYAAGYILGGLIATALGWRAAFLLEAAAMLPFATFCAVGPALDLRGKPRHTGIHTTGQLAVSHVCDLLRMSSCDESDL